MSSPAVAPKTKVRGLTHGKPLRGLMSTTSSQLFQGRFGRMFRRLPAAKYGDTDAESRDNLMKLGTAMIAGLDAPKDGEDPEESGIPALYTYFGQFIDHDLTFDPLSSLMKQSDPDALTDFRSPAFDLDNLYGRGPDDQPYMYDGGSKFLLGTSLANGAPDLPRNNASPARAIIGDPRNDENSIVSQLQGLFLRFHNRFVDDNPRLSFSAIQQAVRFHYQWVVMNDFLPRIVCASVLNDLKTNGKYDKSKLKYYVWKNNPFMPVEFSGAAYRLGHSMVRPGYRLNDDDSTLLPIFPSSGTGGLTGFQTMAPNRGIDWGRFIDTDIRSYGSTDPNKQSTDPATKKRLQFAYRLDTSLVEPLVNLPAIVAAGLPHSLAQRNLIRGYELGLPSGQAVAHNIGVTPLADDQIFIGKAVDDPDNTGSDPDVRGTIASISDLAIFKGNTPLWTYVLAEAFNNRAQVKIPVTEGLTISTPQLGPVGGRIVAEVFLGLMFGDVHSYLSLDPNWQPAAQYQLKDMVKYALGQ